MHVKSEQVCPPLVSGPKSKPNTQYCEFYNEWPGVPEKEARIMYRTQKPLDMSWSSSLSGKHELQY